MLAQMLYAVDVSPADSLSGISSYLTGEGASGRSIASLMLALADNTLASVFENVKTRPRITARHRGFRLQEAYTKS